MRNNYYKKGIAIVSASLALCLAMQPLQVSAENVLPTAGVASLLENRLSTSQYLMIAQEMQNATYGYTNLGIANVEKGNLNVRQEPSTDAKLVGKMPKDSACEILEIVDGWAHITSGEIEGYVSCDYLLMGPDAVMAAKDLVQTIVRVDVDGLNVRDQANLDSAVLTSVPKGEELEYIETVDEEWIKVAIDDQEAYVFSDYVVIEEKLPTAITLTELMYGVGVSDVRVDLVEYAKQFLGNPYVWGGTSLTNGADCSGFVMSVYANFGVSLPHSSTADRTQGYAVDGLANAQPGDLICYSGHVALYIGNGQIVHASSSKTGIIISNADYKKILAVRRIF